MSAIFLGTTLLTWHRGFPREAGMYLVQLTDDEHVVTPYTVPGQEGEDTWGDKRRSGWSCLTHSRATVFAWTKLPNVRTLEGAAA